MEMTVDLPREGALPSFGGATGSLNSPPLMSEELRGSVVLVDFWTYTCINWIRTLPLLTGVGRDVRRSGAGRDRCAHA